MAENDLEQFAHKMADEIYCHIENDHVKDDFITWFDLALLAFALIVMTVVPAIGAPMTLMPNVAVKGYQIARRYNRNSKATKASKS